MKKKIIFFWIAFLLMKNIWGDHINSPIIDISKFYGWNNTLVWLIRRKQTLYIQRNYWKKYVFSYKGSEFCLRQPLYTYGWDFFTLNGEHELQWATTGCEQFLPI